MPLFVYSALRLGLFALALVSLWAVGMRDWLLVLVAAVVAWALSYVFLAGPRDAAALWLSQRVEGRSPRFSPGVEADAVAEDAEAEGGRAGGSAGAAREVGTVPEVGAGHAVGSGRGAESEPAHDGAVPGDLADQDTATSEPTTPDGEGQSASPRPSSTP